jgi:hypothetical protein
MAKCFFTEFQEGASLLTKVEKEDENYNTWEIDHEGHITQIDMRPARKSNRLYAVDREKKRTEKYLELKNSDALEELVIPKKATINGKDYPARFAHGGASDLAAIFLFASDNTDREWYFCRYNAGNGDEYAVGTVHEEKLAIIPRAMGIDPQKEIASIHSHPNEKTGTTEKEFESMGWWIDDDYNERFKRAKGTPRHQGDSERVYSNRNNLPVNQHYYVYLPHTGNIYRVRGWDYPERIRNIKNHNNNPSSLLQGYFIR